jgi:L-ascorbate metabolism protein UlaG (beta-lactamase superfamily)
VDPYFPSERPAEEFIHPQPPLDESKLKVDYVLLTHEHGDHTCPESLIRIHNAFPNARYIGPEESIERLRESGIPQELYSTVTAGDTIQLGAVTAYAVWAKLPEGVPEDGIPVPDVEHLGYVLEIGSVRVYVSGDLFNTVANHNEVIEPIVKLKPDIGLITLHPTEGEFPYFEGSIELAVKLKLKAAVPAHYGCFVKRTFDPQVWAAGFPADGPTPIIIPYNDAIVYSK